MRPRRRPFALPIPWRLRVRKLQTSDGGALVRGRTQFFPAHPEELQEPRRCPKSSRWHARFVIAQDFVGAELRYDWPFRAAQGDGIELVSEGTSRASTAKPVISFGDC